MATDAALTYRNASAGLSRTEKARSLLWSRRRAASSPDHGPGASETTSTAPPSIVGRNSAVATRDPSSGVTSVRARGLRGAVPPYRRAAWTRQAEASSMIARREHGRSGPSGHRPSVLPRLGLIEIGRSSASMTITGNRRSRAPSPGGAMVDNRDNCVRACTKRFSEDEASTPAHYRGRSGEFLETSGPRRACRRRTGSVRRESRGTPIGAVSRRDSETRPKGGRSPGDRCASPGPPGRSRRPVRSPRRRRRWRGRGGRAQGTEVR